MFPFYDVIMSVSDDTKQVGNQRENTLHNVFSQGTTSRWNPFGVMMADNDLKKLAWLYWTVCAFIVHANNICKCKNFTTL